MAYWDPVTPKDRLEVRKELWFNTDSIVDKIGKSHCGFLDVSKKVPGQIWHQEFKESKCPQGLLKSKLKGNFLVTGLSRQSTTSLFNLLPWAPQMLSNLLSHEVPMNINRLTNDKSRLALYGFPCLFHPFPYKALWWFRGELNQRYYCWSAPGNRVNIWI